MRKLNRLKKRKKIKLILTITILVAIVLVVPAYAYMREQLGVTGKTQIVQQYTEDLCEGNVTYLVESWTSSDNKYYKISFTITNDGDKEYNFWDVYFDVPSDAELSTFSSTEAVVVGNQIKASNVSYNGNLAPGASTSFEVQFTSNEIDYEPKLIYINNCISNSNSNTVIQNKNFSIEFVVTGSYGQYTYQYDVIVTNTGTEKVQGWGFLIEKPANTNLTNAWNANYIIKDDKIEFSNADYNGYIEPGNTVMFGAIIETDIQGFMPVAIIE